MFENQFFFSIFKNVQLISAPKKISIWLKTFNKYYFRHENIRIKAISLKMISLFATLDVHRALSVFYYI